MDDGSKELRSRKDEGETVLDTALLKDLHNLQGFILDKLEQGQGMATGEVKRPGRVVAHIMSRLVDG